MRVKKRRSLKGFIPSDQLLLNRSPIIPVDLKKSAAIHRAMKVQQKVRTMKDKFALDIKISQGIRELLQKLEGHSGDIVRSFSIDRGFIGRSVNITTTATKIITSTYARGYRILNPAASAGLTTTSTLIPSTSFSAGDSGDTQDSGNNPNSVGPLGVANYQELRLFLDISAISGATVTVNAQSKDPISGNWVTVQSSVFSETTTGTFYANLGNEGIDNSFAISYTVTGGTATCSLGGILKNGLAGSSTGLTNKVYIAALDSVNATMGFPLLEGQEFNFFAAENTEIWAVSESSGGIPLKIFELQ